MGDGQNMTTPATVRFHASSKKKINYAKTVAVIKVLFLLFY
jgi:hypothetical protein